MSLPYLKKYTIVFIYVLLCCFATTTFSQENTETLQEIDTIAFKKTLEDKSFDEVINEYYLYRQKDSVKAALIIKQIEKNRLKSESKKEVVNAYLTMAQWKHDTNDYKGAIANYDLAITQAVDLKDKNILYNCYLKKGACFFGVGANEEALECVLKALILAEELNDTRKKITAIDNIILIQIQVNDNKGAIDLYLDNLKRIENSKNENLVVEKLRIYLGLTKAYINLEEYEKAIEYCENGLEMSLEMESVAFQAYFNTFLGEIQSNQGQMDKAFASFNKAYELNEKAGGDITLDIFLKLYIGKTYYYQHKYNDALQEFLKCEELIENYKLDFLSIQQLYVYIAKSYSALKNEKDSNLYFNKANDIDSKNDKTRALLNSRIVKETLAKLREEIQTLESKSKQTKYFYFSGIIILLFIIITLIIFYKKQQQKNKQRFANLMNQLEEKRQKGKVKEEKVISEEKIQKQPIEIDAKIAVILKKLDEFEEKELFLSKDSTLVEVAKKIQTNTTYLSKVINTHKEKSFTSYITDLRVDYAIERLSHDRKFRSFTIGAIAQEIGFKRSESFSKAFKVKTGLYPSYFIKELEKQIDSSEG